MRKYALMIAVVFLWGTFTTAVQARNYDRVINMQDISGEDIGVLVEEDERVLVLNTKIHDNRKGIYVMKGGHLTIMNSIVRDNDEEGIDIRENTMVRIYRNFIYNNGESGVETEGDGVNVKINKNVILKNKHGITVQFRKGEDGYVRIGENDVDKNDEFGLRCNAPLPEASMDDDYYADVISLRGDLDDKIDDECDL